MKSFFSVQPLCLCASVVLLLVSVSAHAGDPAEAAESAQHVFYLGDERVVVLRFEVYLDGKPFRAVWEEFLGQRFRQLDANGDNVLQGDELRGLPSRDLLAQVGIAAPTAWRVRPSDASATREEFADHFRQLGVTPFRVRAGQNVPTAVRAPVDVPQRAAAASPRDLFDKLDADGNGRIVANDFRHATHLLRKLDLDRDESISSSELAPAAAPRSIAVVNYSGSAPAPAPAFLAAEPGDEQELVKQLLALRDGHGDGGTKDNRLSFAEVGLAAEQLKRFDADGYGSLDSEELLRFVAAPPEDVRLIVRVGVTRSQRPIEILDPAAGSEASVAGSPTFGKVQMELEVGRMPANDERSLKQTFTQMDRDANGYLDSMEAQRFGPGGGLLGLMDADKDGKVFSLEFINFYLSVAELAQARVELEVIDSGRDLFRILDADSDDRLGPREFLAAIPRIAQWDANADQELAYNELPQQFRLSVGRGSMRALGPRVLSVVPAPAAPGIRSRPPAGPPWFIKMDRNGDGDISRREFLGPDQIFAGLDQDANGLLDANEAAASR